MSPTCCERCPDSAEKQESPPCTTAQRSSSPGPEPSRRRELVTVSAGEPWDQRCGRADCTGDEEVLVPVAECAVTVLE